MSKSETKNMAIWLCELANRLVKYAHNQENEFDEQMLSKFASLEFNAEKTARELEAAQKAAEEARIAFENFIRTFGNEMGKIQDAVNEAHRVRRLANDLMKVIHL